MWEVFLRVIITVSEKLKWSGLTHMYLHFYVFMRVLGGGVHGCKCFSIFLGDWPKLPTGSEILQIQPRVTIFSLKSRRVIISEITSIVKQVLERHGLQLVVVLYPHPTSLWVLIS